MLTLAGFLNLIFEIEIAIAHAFARVRDRGGILLWLCSLRSSHKRYSRKPDLVAVENVLWLERDFGATRARPNF